MHLLKEGNLVQLEYTGSEETRYKRKAEEKSDGFYMPVECNIDFILSAMEDSHFWPQHNSLAQAYSPTDDKYKSWRNYLKKMIESARKQQRQ